MWSLRCLRMMFILCHTVLGGTETPPAPAVPPFSPNITVTTKTASFIRVIIHLHRGGGGIFFALRDHIYVLKLFFFFTSISFEQRQKLIVVI